MPLNYTTIDFVFKKCLSDSSLEFQATGEQILNEIKKFAKKQETGCISFNAFTRVLLKQYKATPYPELKLLLTRIKRYQMGEIFATNKKDCETLFKTIKNNSATIIDLSGVEAGWQKVYLEYIIENLNEKVYLITRINDENCDVDLINKIYCKKKNITFVPNVSYNYKKLPSITQYCKNYILLPSLYQRNDFLDANFALANLISDGCIIFGENTDYFLYLIKDYELTIQKKRKNYRKIALTLVEEDEREDSVEQQLGEKGDYYENIKKETPKTDSEKLIEELTKFEQENNPTPTEDIDEKNITKTVEETSEDEEEINDYFDEVTNDNEIEIEDEGFDEFPEIGNKAVSPTNEQAIINTEKEDLNIKEDKEEPEKSFQFEIEDEEEIEKEAKEEPEDEVKEEITEEAENSEKTEEIEKAELDESLISKSDITNIGLVDPDTIEIEDEEEKIEEKKEEENSEEIPLAEDLSDDELDFFELAMGNNSKEEIKIQEEVEPEETEEEIIKEETAEIEIEEAPQEEIKPEEAAQEEIEATEETIQEIQLETIEETESEETEIKENEEIDLNDIADKSVDESFEQIVDSKPKEKLNNTIEIDKNIKISADILEKSETNSSLPIFKENEEEENDDMPEFKKDLLL